MKTTSRRVWLWGPLSPLLAQGLGIHRYISRSTPDLTWKISIPEMKAARRVRLCRPLPPTPTSSMWPPGCLSRRQMRLTCRWVGCRVQGQRTSLVGVGFRVKGLGFRDPSQL